MNHKRANSSLVGEPAERQHSMAWNTAGRVSPLRAAVCCILAGSVLLAAAGCQSTRAQKPEPISKILELEQEKSQLQSELGQLTLENKQLREQVEVLRGLPEDKIQDLCHLESIKITRYTNFYDKNDDGKKDKLIVYIQPIDEDGDIIKAPGEVDVQLWDLNEENGKALLGEWHVEQSELRKLWFKTIVTVNYRLMFDVADKVESLKDPMTVYVTFTDYLTGKVFKEQKAIRPR